MWRAWMSLLSRIYHSQVLHSRLDSLTRCMTRLIVSISSSCSPKIFSSRVDAVVWRFVCGSSVDEGDSELWLSLGVIRGVGDMEQSSSTLSEVPVVESWRIESHFYDCYSLYYLWQSVCVKAVVGFFIVGEWYNRMFHFLAAADFLAFIPGAIFIFFIFISFVVISRQTPTYQAGVALDLKLMWRWILDLKWFNLDL